MQKMRLLFGGKRRESSTVQDYFSPNFSPLMDEHEHAECRDEAASEHEHDDGDPGEVMDQLWYSTVSLEGSGRESKPWNL